MQLTEEKFNARDADTKFSNLLSSMHSGLSFNLLSYRLLLHDLEGAKAPFHRPNPETFSASEKEVELVKSMIQRKLDNLSPLSTSDPEFPTIHKFLEGYGYGYTALSENTLIERIPNTDYIQVTFSSDKPGLSAFAANTFCEEFFRYHHSQKKERGGESLEFLEQLVANKKEELNEKLETQKMFTSTNQVYDPNESGVKLGQLASLESERDIIRNRMYRLELTIRRLEDDIRRIGAPVQTNDNQKVLELTDKINKLNERYITGGSSNQRLLDSLNILREQRRIQLDNATRQGPSIPQGYTVADLQIKLKDAQIEHDVESSALGVVESKIRNLQ